MSSPASSARSQQRFSHGDKAATRPFGAFETALAALICGLYSCDIIRIVFHADDGAGDLFRVVALSIYAATVFLLAPHGRAVLLQAAQAPLLTTLVLLPLVSIAWSTNPSGTLIRGIMLLGSSLFGFYVAIRLPARVLLRIISMAAFGVALLSIFLIFFVPSIGIEQKEPWIGAWNGAYIHKNGLGGNMALSAGLITLYLLEKEARRSWWPFLALASCLFLLFASKSVTGQVTYVISVLSIIMIRNFLGLLRSVLLPIGVVLVPLVLLPLAFLDGETFADLAAGLGRDMTLSGRVPLWNAVWPFIENRFWLGYGYEAFWVDTQEAMRVIEEQAKFRAFYSHNGLLELMLAVGALGTGIFLTVLVLFMSRLSRVISRYPLEIFSSMAAVFIFTFVLRNVSEVAILTRHDMGWCMFIALHLKLRTATLAIRQAGASETRRIAVAPLAMAQGRTT